MKLLTKFFSKDKKMKIDFCEKNLDRFVTNDLFSQYQSLLNKRNIIYKEYECQNKCKECKKSPYAIVDGNFIDAESSEELLDKLKQLYEEM